MKKSVQSAMFLVFVIFSAWGLSFAWPVPDSGQTKCYNNTEEIPCPQPGEPFYGQDGNFTINPPSYTKLDENGNDLPDSAATWVMVRDNVTGLIWEVKHVSDDVADYDNPNDPDNSYYWFDSNPETNGGDGGTFGYGINNTEGFIAPLNTDRFGGFSDWRLPSQEELRSIAMLGSVNPAINTGYFPNTVSSYYWSSTTDTDGTDGAESVYFDYGDDLSYGKSNSCYVRAVRSGQDWLLDHLIINGDGTVTDNKTGLMWEVKHVGDGVENYDNPHDADNLYDWQDALGTFIPQVKVEKFAGYNDWRLPAKEELRSLADLSKYSPAIDTGYFPNTVSSWYWSSTTYAGYTDRAWDVYFGYGYGYGYSSHKSGSRYVRAVRSGQVWHLGHLIISEPRQGSSWSIGDTMTITWDTQNLGGDVEISLSTQGGKDNTFSPIATTANDGSYDWTVSASPSVNCALKIVPLNDTGKDTTQSLFTINTPPSLTISAPPTDPSNQTTATFTIGGNNVAYYRYRLNNGNSVYSPVSKPLVLNNLSDGLQTLEVIGQTAWANWELTSTTISWTVETVPPEIGTVKIANNHGFTNDPTPDLALNSTGADYIVFKIKIVKISNKLAINSKY